MQYPLMYSSAYQDRAERVAKRLQMRTKVHEHRDGIPIRWGVVAFEGGPFLVIDWEKEEVGEASDSHH